VLYFVRQFACNLTQRYFALGQRLRWKNSYGGSKGLLYISDPSAAVFLLRLVHNCACLDKLPKQVTSTCRTVFKFKVVNPFLFSFKIMIYLFLTAYPTFPSGFLLH
jgi:hypothetical protein